MLDPFVSPAMVLAIGNVLIIKCLSYGFSAAVPQQTTKVLTVIQYFITTQHILVYITDL